jgi:tRNA threonylcarbamoyladenosine biosynthesis protein TsaE
MNCGELGSSPTYSIVNEYLSPTYGKIVHLDLYRLKSLEEAFDIGIEDILYDTPLCFIEWPAIISNLLPDSHVWVKIEVNDENHRLISFEL